VIRRPLSTAEFKILRDGYAASRPAQAIADELGRTVHMIRNTAVKHGIRHGSRGYMPKAKAR